MRYIEKLKPKYAPRHHYVYDCKYEKHDLYLDPKNRNIKRKFLLKQSLDRGVMIKLNGIK